MMVQSTNHAIISWPPTTLANCRGKQSNRPTVGGAKCMFGEGYTIDSWPTRSHICIHACMLRRRWWLWVFVRLIGMVSCHRQWVPPINFEFFKSRKISNFAKSHRFHTHMEISKCGEEKKNIFMQQTNHVSHKSGQDVYFLVKGTTLMGSITFRRKNDVCASLLIFDKSLKLGGVMLSGRYNISEIRTTSRKFRFLRIFQEKSEIILGAEIWDLWCRGRGNPLEIIPSHLVRWREGDDKRSTSHQSWEISGFVWKLETFFWICDHL